MLKCFICISFSLLISITFLGCEEKQDLPREQENAVKIGVIYPFTGPSGSSGNDLRAGTDLAAEIVNQSPDLPIPLARTKGLSLHGNSEIQIIYRDSQGDPSLAAELLEELVKTEGVVAIMGCYNSTVTAAASERAEMMGIPFLNATSTSPTLVQRGFKWFFRTTPDDEAFARNFFTFLSDLPEWLKLEIPKQVILVYENQLWGTNVARTERKLSVKNGYQILEDIPYDTRSIDLSEELRRVKMASPAIILQASYADDAILFMQGYKGFQINPTAILAMDSGFIAPCFLERLGPDAEYVLSREVWASDLGIRKPLVRKINDLFVKRFGRNMSGNSARAFTCFMTLADAIHRAISLDAENIRAALLATDISEDALIMPWNGVRFDPDTGQNILGSGIIVQVQGGEYKTVWPRNLSSAPLIWPMPSWSERKVQK